MSFVLKILGNFRWLFLLIGVLIASLVAWLLFPKQSPQNSVSQQVIQVTDSSEISALRDSLTMLRTHTQSTRIIRVTLRDTINGTSAIYLDSGAVVHDTVAMTRVIRDTVAIHVRDSIYVKERVEQITKKRWSVDAGAFVSHGASFSGVPDYGASAGIRYKLIGPFFVGGNVDKKGFHDVVNGWTLKASAGFEF